MVSKASAALTIQQYATEVPDGGEGRFVCPKCGGGQSGERSLSIRRSQKNFAFYICWRAKCDLGKGKVSLFGDGNILWNGYQKGLVTERKVWEPATCSLDEGVASFLKNKYLLEDGYLLYAGICQTNQDRRVVFPMWTPKRTRKGKVVRAYRHLYRGWSEYCTVPKAITVVPDKSVPMTSWYYRHRMKAKSSDTLVVVEDVLSALRLTDHTDAVALLGTNFAIKSQTEIATQGYKNIYLALDPDASKKAARLVRQNKSKLPGLKLKLLDKDVKDMTHEELYDTCLSLR